jgi:SAM-dependent methyltransferase
VSDEGKFWSEKAKNFPVYNENDAEDMATINSIVGIAESHGVVIDGKKIIDIGCGTGRHTLTLAKRAKAVTGTDVSPAMVETLLATSKKYSFNNVDTLVCDWRDADIKQNGWLKSFDIAWAAMTSALSGRESVEKMNSCAREHCVCTAWGRKRENELLSEVFKAHGGELNIPFSAVSLSAALKDMNIAHTLDFIDNSWESEAGRADTLKDMAWHLEINGIKPDADLIEKILHRRYGDSPRISHKTFMEMGVLTWRPQ